MGDFKTSIQIWGSCAIQKQFLRNSTSPIFSIQENLYKQIWGEFRVLQKESVLQVHWFVK